MGKKAEQEDRSVIEQVLHGNRDSYRLLVERHYPTAYRMAFRITGNAEDAEESAQDAFFRAYRKLAEFRHDSNFSTWVNRIAMNSALNLVERRTRDLTHAADRVHETTISGAAYTQVADGKAGPERLLLDAETSRFRRSAMDTLTPMERTAFTLRHMEDMPIAEIAAALKVPANSAKQAVFRAVSKLRHALAPFAGGIQ